MYYVKCTKTLTGTPFFHCKCVNLTISQQQYSVTIANSLDNQLWTFAIVKMTFETAAFCRTA